jgi:hypothetical protein
VVGPSSTAPAPTLTQLILNPSGVTLAPGGSQRFTVAGSWSDGSSTVPAVTYTAAGGTITAAGLYTAGNTAGIYRVIAVQSGGTRADTSTVTISAATLTSLTVSPKVFSLSTGGTQQMTVTALWSDGSTTLPTLTWDASGGTISSSGLYTAGSVAGNYWLTVSAGGLSDAAVMTVTTATTTATVTQFTLSPGSATLATGATQQFQTAATWSDGVSRSVSVTYSATGGTVSTGGLYTAGQAAGTFAVIATCGCGKADTSAVVIGTQATRTLTSLTLSPKVVSLPTGGTQQFTATALWSDGSTTLPPLTWNASGGTITSGGLYTAGSVAGNYWAAVSAGGLSDAAVLTLSTSQVPSSSQSGFYPNRPSNYTTVLAEFDGSATVPDNPGVDRPIAGTSWWTIFDNAPDGTSDWTKVSDPTAPQSGPDVWRLRFYPGTWSIGHGFGNLYTNLPATNRELYLSLQIKWDSQFEWNTSTKLLWFDAGAILFPVLESGVWLNADMLGLTTPMWYNPQVNTPITLGVWHHIELVLKRGNPGTIQIWLDGVLRTNYTNANVPEPNNVWSHFLLTGHLGGGGMTKLRDSYYWIDHILIAAP